MPGDNPLEDSLIALGQCVLMARHHAAEKATERPARG